MLSASHTNGSSPPHRRDYLGRPLRIGDVVVYAVLIRRMGGGQPLRRGVILDFEGPYAWIRMLADGGRAATVRIHQDRVLKMPGALPARQAARLRAHRFRLRGLAGRAEQSSGQRSVAQTGWTTEPITPEQTLAAAGIDDARQAEYQRKMSALLAGRS
jgi:hypothetical protein